MDHIANTTAIENTDMETVESLLADLDLEEIVTEAAPVEEAIEEIVADDPTEDEAAALDTQIAKSEAYEEQSATAASAAPVNLAPDPSPAKAAKTPKAPKAPKAPAAPRDLSSLPDGAFVLTLAPPADLVANRAAVMAKRPSQKKIADKFDNLLLAVAAGKAPSEYTVHCFKALAAAGTVTQGDLVSTLTATTSNRGSGYTIGTARSQAGQFMVLADALGIATRTKNTLVLNPDSSLAQALAAL
jgi:hypothetical protein